MSVEARLQKIEKLISEISNPKPKWVKSTIIKDLTGWDPNKMAKARKYGYLKWKTDSEGYWYDLNTLHPLFIKSVETNKNSNEKKSI